MEVIGKEWSEASIKEWVDGCKDDKNVKIVEADVPPGILLSCRPAKILEMKIKTFHGHPNDIFEAPRIDREGKIHKFTYIHFIVRVM